MDDRLFKVGTRVTLRKEQDAQGTILDTDSIECGTALVVWDDNPEARDIQWIYKLRVLSDVDDLKLLRRQEY